MLTTGTGSTVFQGTLRLLPSAASSHSDFCNFPSISTNGFIGVVVRVVDMMSIAGIEIRRAASLFESRRLGDRRVGLGASGRDMYYVVDGSESIFVASSGVTMRQVIAARDRWMLLVFQSVGPSYRGMGAEMGPSSYTEREAMRWSMKGW